MWLRFACALLAFASPIAAQSPPAAPRFDVASIKPCDAAAPSSAGGRKGGNSDVARSSPVTFTLPCSTVRFYITLAYIISNSPPGSTKFNPLLEGGPGWIDSERYQISAKSSAPVSKTEMNGSMLRALLEDRFHLALRRETREIPMYALALARGGLKLRPWDGQSCAPRDLSNPSLPPGEKPWCGMAPTRKSATAIKTDLPGGTMAQFAHALGMLDRTGLPDAEKFDFHVEYAPDDANLTGDSAAPSLDSVLREMGLRRERVQAPREFLVIAHIERPSEN